MIDLFGIKARKLLAVAKEHIADQNAELAALRGTRVAQAVVIREQGDAMGVFRSQIKQLRDLAGELRDRIHSHGKTTAEGDFIATCEDIYTNGKMLSSKRFVASMQSIQEERKSMEDFKCGE